MAHEEPSTTGSPGWSSDTTSCPRGGGEFLVWHVGTLHDPDLAVLGRLARVHLTARRQGQAAVFCHAPPELVALVSFAGLGSVLDLRSSVEPWGEPEQREQPLRAEKRVHGPDLPG